MVPMKDALAALDSSAKKLNEKSESHNKLIEQLEKRLQASQVGVSVWLDRMQMLDAEAPRAMLDKNGDPVGDLVEASGWILGFTKIENEWRIAVRPSRQEWTPALVNSPNEDLSTFAMDEPRPLLKAPRAVRVEAAQHLENLVWALVDRANSFASDIEAAELLVVDDEKALRIFILRSAAVPGGPGKAFPLTDANKAVANQLHKQALLEKPETGEVRGEMRLVLRLTAAGAEHVKNGGL